MTTSAQTTNRPWSPNANAHLIYQWVKMEGKTQAWVASALNISQPTVSRILQRYDRWQAHAKERENGRLDPAERLRAQRWLTFERNELILTSCLRIAQDMEGSIDTSKSTIHRQASRPSQETEIRTQHATIDRTGSVARFLRLAFRINMEQLKLAQLDPPPLAQPLTEEEQAAEALQAALDDQELLAAKSSRHTPCAVAPESASTSPQPPEPMDTVPPSPPPSVSPSPDPAPAILELRLTPAARVKADRIDPLSTHHSLSALHTVHNLHNENEPENAASQAEPCTCAAQPCAEKNSPATRITKRDTTQWPADETPEHVPHRLATSAVSQETGRGG